MGLFNRKPKQKINRLRQKLAKAEGKVGKGRKKPSKKMRGKVRQAVRRVVNNAKKEAVKLVAAAIAERLIDSDDEEERA